MQPLLSASPYSSAQRARQLLASRLVEIMKDAHLSARELARRLGWHESKISRIANAVTPPSEDDVRAWCAACGSAEAADLVASLRVAQGMWVERRRMERTGLRVAQEQMLPLFERTTEFCAYSPSIVVGMVQTPEYLTAVLRSTQRRRELVDDVETAVAARMRRQRLLHDPAKKFALIIEESALRCLVADAETMAGQLRHLLSVLGMPNVSLGVIPQAARRTLWPVEGFWIYGREQASAELVSGFLTVTQPREVDAYRATFAELSAHAVYRLGARRLITLALNSLEQHCSGRKSV